MAIQPFFIGDYFSGITLESHSAQFLAIRMAVDVIQACEHNVPDTDVDPSDVISRRILDTNWASAGITNTIGNYVQVLEALVEARILEHSRIGHSILLYNDTAAYIVKALTVFGEWKQKAIHLDQERHGEGWGRAQGWNQWNVTEKLEAFYATFHEGDRETVKRLL